VGIHKTLDAQRTSTPMRRKGGWGWNHLTGPCRAKRKIIHEKNKGHPRAIENRFVQGSEAEGGVTIAPKDFRRSDANLQSKRLGGL